MKERAEKMNKLTEIRKQKNLTQAELAKLCNISRPMLARYESGERNLATAQAFTVLKIAHALETTVETLIGDDK